VEYIPLSDATMSEVLARVTYRVIQRDYHQWAEEYHPPEKGMVYLSKRLDYLGFGVLATWVLAYVREWSPLQPVGFIREAMCFRARSGLSWRAVAYPQYKSQRRDDPRVTNRGVRGSSRSRGTL
jgi:hypothetical protein